MKLKFLLFSTLLIVIYYQNDEKVSSLISQITSDATPEETKEKTTHIIKKNRMRLRSTGGQKSSRSVSHNSRPSLLNQKVTVRNHRINRLRKRKLAATNRLIQRSKKGSQFRKDLQVKNKNKTKDLGVVSNYYPLNKKQLAAANLTINDAVAVKDGYIIVPAIKVAPAPPNRIIVDKEEEIEVAQPFIDVLVSDADSIRVIQSEFGHLPVTNIISEINLVSFEVSWDTAVSDLEKIRSMTYVERASFREEQPSKRKM